MQKLEAKPRHHPAVAEKMEKLASDAQLRLADRITAFAGSMTFVYLHIVVFAVWMIVFEKSPWPTLTLAVSLEAIFLSTFVMIGQNRQAAFQQAKADRDYREEEQMLVLEVIDHGPGFAFRGRGCPDPLELEERGRGLWLMASMTDRVQVRHERGGTQVRLERDLPGILPFSKRS